MKLDLSSLNSQQRKAVQTVDRPVLVLAGAGSGKTRVITYRIASLMKRHQVKAENILALTFTNKAAREMKDRIRSILGPTKGLTVTTFHALCVRILRESIHVLGYHPNFVIYGTPDQQALIKSVYEDIGLEDGDFIKPNEAHFEIMKAKSLGVPPRSFLAQRDNPKAQILGKIFERYNQLLQGCNAIDFEDILYLTQNIFMEFAEETKNIRTRFHHILVDEYQDTNRVQYQLVKKLVETGGYLCVVGDDDQSIYGWRGADITNIVNFQKDFPDAEIIRLEQNYRSTNTILKAANSVIGNNHNRMSKELWSAQGEGNSIKWIFREEEQEELEAVIQHMKACRIENSLRWSQFAILFRSNHQARAIEQQLREESVPYRLVGGTRFFERKEIQDCIAYLKVIHNPNDEVSLHRILNFPRRGIGKNTLVALNEARQNNNLTLFEVIADARKYIQVHEGALRSLETFARRIRDTRKSLRIAPFPDVCKELFQSIGMVDAFIKEEKNPDTQERRKNNYYEFMNTMYLYGTRNEGATLTRFLEYLSLFTEAEPLEEKKDKLILMTVHSAKGLEFDYVALVNLTEGQFPNHRSVMENGLEEERRLFYVAITRARRWLTMSMAKSRLMYGKPQGNLPSPFLREIQSRLFDQPPFGDVNPVKQKENRLSARARFFARQKVRT